MQPDQVDSIIQFFKVVGGVGAGTLFGLAFYVGSFTTNHKRDMKDINAKLIELEDRIKSNKQLTHKIEKTASSESKALANTVERNIIKHNTTEMNNLKALIEKDFEAVNTSLNRLEKK